MDKELQQVSKRMSQLYNIEAYDTLDFSSELNAETLMKAKEYFLRKQEYYGHELDQVTKEVEIAHTWYKMKYSEAVLMICDEIDPATNKKYTMGKAEHKANLDVEYIQAKEEWAELLGKKERVKAMYYMIGDRIQAISQHISILKQEFNFNQFQKSNETNS